jgi:hypothetical protein
MTTLTQAAGRAVAGIVEDLTGRSGLDGAWDSIDDETKVEILVRWQDIMTNEFRQVMQNR